MSRIVIFANGILSQPDLLKDQLRASDRIFCVDGGTNHALSLAVMPEVIVGDLDSLSPDVLTQMQRASVTIRRYPPAKDQTDLELALELAVAEGPQEIVLLTALGGRLDQMLANILLLANPDYSAVRLSLIDGPQQATVVHQGQTISIDGQPGDTLSLVPLSPVVEQVRLTGVRWPLTEATLSFGSTLSISNELAAPQANLQIGAGTILLIYFDQRFKEEKHHDRA